MHYEVEIKYKVNNNQVLSSILDESYLIKSEESKDIYFVSGNDTERYRLRCTTDSNIVTIKSNDRIEFSEDNSQIPIQVCKEFEYEVSEVDDFIAFSEMIGFHKNKEIIKTKRKYRIRNINIEVNTINKVDVFLELEILCQQNQISNSKKELVKIFNYFGLDSQFIITKKYTDLF